MILVSGDGKLAKALVDLSSDDIQITKLPKKVMDITDEYEVSEVIKQYMTQPDYPKYFVHTAALTKPMNINDRNPIIVFSLNSFSSLNISLKAILSPISQFYQVVSYTKAPNRFC